MISTILIKPLSILIITIGELSNLINPIVSLIPSSPEAAQKIVGDNTPKGTSGTSGTSGGGTSGTTGGGNNNTSGTIGTSGGSGVSPILTQVKVSGKVTTPYFAPIQNATVIIGSFPSVKTDSNGFYTTEGQTRIGSEDVIIVNSDNFSQYFEPNFKFTTNIITKDFQLLPK